MDKHFGCANGHRWQVSLDGPLAVVVDCIACPECGAPAETLVTWPLPMSADSRSDAAAEKDTHVDHSCDSNVAEHSAGAGADRTPVDRKAETLPPRPAPADLDIPPELVDHPRYRVLGMVGTGGMGTVYQAQHLLMDRLVAIKVIRKSFLEHPGAVERFQREVKAAARLAHPNIVMAYDAEQAGDLHLLVMEFIDGTNLTQQIERHGRLPVAEACDCVRQALLGLQHAHERGMVHRDLKPSNLMRTSEGVVKILDLGLARWTREGRPEGGLTQTGIVMGTVDYMAPEQADSARQADIRADIYSLGCTLYHLLTGQPPFTTGSLREKLAYHQHEDPPPIDRSRSDIPPGLNKVVRKMMAKRPQDRFQTPADAAAALLPFSRAMHPPTVSVWRRPVIAASVLLLVGLLVFTAIRIATDKGELEIKSSDDDVRIVVLRGGREIEIIDLKTTQRIKLRSGLYDLKLVGQTGDLVLSTDKFELKRGARQIVEVRWAAAQSGQELAASKPPELAPVAAERTEGQIRTFDGQQTFVRWVAVSPDGRRAVSVGGPRNQPDTLRVWNVATGKESGRISGHTDSVASVAFAPDGRHVLTGSRDKTVRYWDLDSGKMLGRGVAQYPIAVAISPDGTSALAASWDDTVQLFELPGCKEIRRFDELTHWSYAVAFSPKGDLAATAGGGPQLRKEQKGLSPDFNIWLWDTKQFKMLHRFAGHSGPVMRLAFSPDAKQLLSCSADNTIRLWDVNAKKELKQFRTPADVTGLAFHSQSRHVLFSDRDGMVRLWNLADGRELLHSPRQPRALTNVAVPPTGGFALFGVGNNVKQWILPSP